MRVGRPLNSRATPDGGRVGIYRYRAYQDYGRRDALMGKGDDLWVGWAVRPDAMMILDPFVLTPYALCKVATHPREQVEIGFGPDGCVAWVSSAPVLAR